MNELAMSRTDKYTHTIVEFHSIDGMQLNIEHYVDKQSRQCYVIRIGPLWTCIQYVLRNVEHITISCFPPHFFLLTLFLLGLALLLLPLLMLPLQGPVVFLRPVVFPPHFIIFFLFI